MTSSIRQEGVSPWFLQHCRGGSLCCSLTEHRLCSLLAIFVPCIIRSAVVKITCAACVSCCAGYAVDITIPSMRVAVEADGPSHFSRTPGPSGRLLQLGATAMKRRHLQQLGWTVVNVPYSDWDKQVDEQQRVGYLKQRIAQATKEGAAAAAAAAQGAGPQ